MSRKSGAPAQRKMFAFPQSTPISGPLRKPKESSESKRREQEHFATNWTFSCDDSNSSSFMFTQLCLIYFGYTKSDQNLPCHVGSQLFLRLQIIHLVCRAAYLYTNRNGLNSSTSIAPTCHMAILQRKKRAKNDLLTTLAAFIYLFTYYAASRAREVTFLSCNETCDIATFQA